MRGALGRGSFFLPRPLHPAAWWGWAVGCVVAASRTTNPLLLGLILAIVCFMVVIRRTNAPWAMAFRMYVYLAVFIVVLRLGFRILFSAAGPTVLVRLPVLTLPGFLTGVRLFGPISAEALLITLTSAMQLAVMVLAIGAANALANPKRLLAAVPGALYEWGTVIVIAISVFPQLAESVDRVRRARQLRAETGKNAHLIRNVAMPVLSDALDRSLLLAGAMDSRGYGQAGATPISHRRRTSALLLISTLAICVGAYGLLDTGMTPVWMGAPMVVVGLIGGVVALKLAGQRVKRTRYRPDSMRAPEWVVLASAALAAAGLIAVAALQPQVAYPGSFPLSWPPVSLLALASILILLIPAFATPIPEDLALEVKTNSSEETTEWEIQDSTRHSVELRPRLAVPHVAEVV